MVSGVVVVVGVLLCSPGLVAGSERPGCGPIDVVAVFGADPSGAVPATASIQRALDDAKNCGGATVIVPPGSYLIDAPLRIGNNVTLRGAGTQASILRAPGCGHLLVNIDHAQGNAGIRVEAVTLEGGFEGRSAGRCGQQLIRFEHVVDFEIRDVELAHAFDNGLVLGRGCSRGVVENVHSHDHGGIGFYVQNVVGEETDEVLTFIGCRADANGSNGFAAYRSKGIGYRRCQATANGRLAPNGAGFNLDGSHFVTFRECVARFNGVGFASYSWSREDSTRYAAEGLRYDGCRATANRDRGFLFQSPLGVEMSGCDAVANGRGGIAVIDSQTGASPALSVVGCAVRGNRGKGIDADRTDAVFVTGTSIKGNGRRTAGWSDPDQDGGDDNDKGEGLPVAAGEREDPGGPQGGDCPQLWRWSDEFVEGVAVAGDHAYLATEIGLVVLDLSDMSSPTEVGRMSTPGHGLAVAVDGNKVFMTTYSTAASSLLIIDVAEPSQPVLIGSMTTQGDALSVAVAGTIAYLAAGDDGLRVVDATDPASPVEIGAIADDWEARDVVVRDDYAYVAAGWSGLRIVDVSDPAHPLEVGDSNTRRAANGIDLAGGYAFLAVTQQAAVAVSVVNPHAPFMVWLRHTSGVSKAIEVQGGLAHIACRFNGLTTFDIAHPTRPSLAGTFDTPGSAVDVDVTGGHVLIADRTEGLAIWRLCALFSDSFESRSTEGWARAVPASTEAEVRGRELVAAL